MFLKNLIKKERVAQISMTMSANFSIGEMNQTADALENAGWTSNDVTKLRQCTDLKGLKALVNGFAKLEIIDHLIDCDVLPKRKEITVFKIKKHKKMGLIEFDPWKVSLFSFNVSITGLEAQKKFAKKPFLNANFLEYLLEHQALIPESWKGKRIFFMNSVYTDSFKNEVVRYIIWNQNSEHWVDGIFSEYEKFKPEDVALMIKYPADLELSGELINCYHDPSISAGFRIKEHIKSSQFKFNEKAISLYSSKRQQEEGFILGHRLRDELKEQLVLNACVLDYLLAHPELIPNKWKGKVIAFFGTVYEDIASGYLHFRYLEWNGVNWREHYRCLNTNLGNPFFVAVKKKF